MSRGQVATQRPTTCGLTARGAVAPSYCCYVSRQFVTLTPPVGQRKTPVSIPASGHKREWWCISFAAAMFSFSVFGVTRVVAQVLFYIILLLIESALNLEFS